MHLIPSIIYTATTFSAISNAFTLWSNPEQQQHNYAPAILQRASIWGLPDCASTCVTSSFGGCSTIDVECICKNKDFLENLGCCISKACSENDQDAAIQFANNFCSPYKVTNLPTAATCASTAAAAAATTQNAATTTPAPTLDPSSPTSLLPALSSAASAAVANVTNSTISVSVRNVTVTATVTVASSSSTNAAGVAAEVTGWAWGVGAVLAGAAAVVV